MILPAYILLALLFFGFFVYWGLVFIIIYHLTRFGIGTLPKKVAVLFFFGTMLLSFLSFSLYASIDKGALKQSLIKYTSQNKQLQK